MPVCASRGHKSAFVRAQRCPYLGTIVPFLRRFANLAKLRISAWHSFSYFLIIEIDSSSISIKIDVVDFGKTFIA